MTAIDTATGTTIGTGIDSRPQHPGSSVQAGAGKDRVIEIGSRKILFKQEPPQSQDAAVSWRSEEGYHVIEHKDGRWVPAPYDRVFLSNFDDAARIASASLDLQQRYYQDKASSARKVKRVLRRQPIVFVAGALIGAIVGWLAHSWAF